MKQPFLIVFFKMSFSREQSTKFAEPVLGIAVICRSAAGTQLSVDERYLSEEDENHFVWWKIERLMNTNLFIQEDCESVINNV